MYTAVLFPLTINAIQSDAVIKLPFNLQAMFNSGLTTLNNMGIIVSPQQLNNGLIILALLLISIASVVSIFYLSRYGIKSHGIRQVKQAIAEHEADALNKLQQQKNALPLMQTHHQFTQLISKLNRALSQLNTAWDKMSWGDKLFDDNEVLSSIDKHEANIDHCQSQHDEFKQQYAAKIKSIEEKYQRDKAVIKQRFEASKNYLIEAVRSHPRDAISKDARIKFALFGSILGASSSLASSFSQSQQVYDAIRSVNGNFESLSDSEIWWECLWMNEASLNGLMSLTKGAYFEQLVAANTGGELHEFFNHPGTDITIAGEEFQLKATDSIAYINSVDADIPVIATSEVAQYTDAIDSGYTNLELTEATSNALGGNPLDTGEAILDGALGGIAGLGVLSTMQGINHASKTYKQTGEADIAVAEGLEIAIIGTIKGLANLAELLYKVITCRPITWLAKSLYRALVFVFRAAT